MKKILSVLVTAILAVVCIISMRLAKEQAEFAKDQVIKVNELRDVVSKRYPRTTRDSIWLIEADAFLNRNAIFLK